MNCKTETASETLISLRGRDTKLKIPIPASWKKSAGLLRLKKRQIKEHLKKIRQEWHK